MFARDPDALLDLIELEVTDSLRAQEENKAVCRICSAWLERFGLSGEVSQDDLCSQKAALDACRGLFKPQTYKLMMEDIEAANRQVQARSAWRVEGTLREFPKFPPVNLWFDYPIHRPDNSGALKDIEPDGDRPPWQKNFGKKKSPKDRKQDRKGSVETAYEACGIDGEVTVDALAEYMGVTEKTVRNRLKEHGGFWIDEGKVGKK